MLKEFDLPFDSEIFAIDDDPALFDPEPDWADGLAPAARDDDDYEGLGLRSVIEKPEVLSKVWRRTTSEKKSFHAAKRDKTRRRKRAWAA